MHSAKPLPAPVVYPETDEMGEHETHLHIMRVLLPLVMGWLARAGRVAHVAGNQFWYFVKGAPKRCRAPDVYVVDGVAQSAPDRGTWLCWEGHRPAFALEVASSQWQKDYDDAPGDYDAMRAKEVVLFDPGATPRSRRRVRWQVYRRVRGRGFVRVFAGGGDRVESHELGCWIRVVDEGGNPRLRLATGAHGDELIPTDGERAASARAAEEAARTAEEAARRETDLAVARAEAAEAELARLRELLRGR